MNKSPVFVYRWCDYYGTVLGEVFSICLQEAKGRWLDKSVLQIRQPDVNYVYIILVPGCTFVIACGLDSYEKTWKKIVDAFRWCPVLRRSFDQWLCTSCLDAYCWPYLAWFWYRICQSGNKIFLLIFIIRTLMFCLDREIHMF